MRLSALVLLASLGCAHSGSVTVKPPPLVRVPMDFGITQTFVVSGTPRCIAQCIERAADHDVMDCALVWCDQKWRLDVGNKD
jgi:hypothetical protein